MNAAAIADGMVCLKDTMMNYEMEGLYNIDETGLFYRLLPCKTFITAMEEG